MSAPPKASRSRVGPLAFVAVLAALVGALLSKCIPGFGFGDAPQSESAEEPEVPPSAREAPQESEAGPPEVRIVVEGDRCSIGSGSPTQCEAVCEQVVREFEGRNVIIEASAGRHGTVEALRSCLEQASSARVRIESE